MDFINFNTEEDNNVSYQQEINSLLDDFSKQARYLETIRLQNMFINSCAGLQNEYCKVVNSWQRLFFGG